MSQESLIPNYSLSQATFENELKNNWGNKILVGVDINGKMPSGIKGTSPGGRTVIQIKNKRQWPIEVGNNEVPSILSYLSSLNYGTYISEYYDCDDRAFWGMAHVRHRYPEQPIGVMSGMAKEGPVAQLADKRHAVIILWYIDKNNNINYFAWDPLPAYQGIVNFGEVKSIIGYPLGVDDNPPAPNKVGLLESHSIVYDIKRIIYPLKDDGNGLLDYLQDQYPTDFEDCPDHNNHRPLSSNDFFKDAFRSWDKSLWAFVHIRRKFPGCAVGVAIGRAKDGSRSNSVLAIWGKENNGSKAIFWDPMVPDKDSVGFDPNLIFV